MVPQEEEEEDFDPIPLTEVPNSKLGLGSMVEVKLDSLCLYGVIQWVGLKQPGNLNSCLVGVELDDDDDQVLGDLSSAHKLRLNDGVYAGVRIFKCPAKRSIFVTPEKLSRDRRFHDQQQPGTSGTKAGGSSSGGSSKQVDNFKMFGHKDCPVVPGFVPPLSE